MSNHPPTTNSSSSDEGSLLNELEQVLHHEREAIKLLNYEEIDHARLEKERLDHALRQLNTRDNRTLTPTQKQDIQAQYQKIIDDAQENNERLHICLQSVQGLLTALTGTRKANYGRRSPRTGESTAVLTSSLG